MLLNNDGALSRLIFGEDDSSSVLKGLSWHQVYCLPLVQPQAKGAVAAGETSKTSK